MTHALLIKLIHLMFYCNLQGFVDDEYYNTYLTRRRVTGRPTHNMIKTG